ncbi:MAG: toll/interleukin-1 receptor domain-containing protein [Panacagrimonas sp.]
MRITMRIFLSYASEDRMTAEEVYYALIAEGHDVFFDRDKSKLQTAGVFHKRIADEIGKADLLIFLISDHSIERGSYALSELELAKARWKHPKGHVVPVLFLGVALEKVPSYLKAANFLEPQGNVAAEVAQSVRTMHSPMPSGDAAGGTGRTPKNGPLKTLLWITVAVGLTLAAARLVPRTDPSPVPDPVTQPDPDQLAYACPELGKFVFNVALGTAYGGVRPRVIEREALPLYSGGDGYGFWIYRQGANVWRRYYFFAASSEMQEDLIPVPPDLYEQIVLEVNLELFKRYGGKGATRDPVRFGNDYVALIDQRVAEHNKANNSLPTETLREVCMRVAVN